MSRDRRARCQRASFFVLRRPSWRRSRTVVLASVALAGALGLSCSGPLRETPEGFLHERHGYRVGAPPAADATWKRVRVDGSVLAYRREAAASQPPVRMTLSSRCGVPLAEPELLARHLRIGVPEHVVRQNEAVEASPLPGWQQVFDVTQDGAVVRVKTVTLVGDRCAYDWVLTARDGAGFEEAEPTFDAWWRSLEVPSVGVAEGGS
ncbi:MAG: hypothetical protein AAF430_17040 [Myxococcota bacterium]